ncbi:CBM_collapsed_G0020720.mRNA.1.CDS.1 [Saccharomyces cerevisiae]|nr:CBM_collapsed_G0020720.mRNA.1.CDS.1 [Saccharomyces cerevisiae]
MKKRPRLLGKIVWKRLKEEEEKDKSKSKGSMAYITMKLVEIWISLPPTQCLQFLKETVIPIMAYPKNDNIKKSVNKLDKQINIADRSLGLQQVDYIKSNKKIYQWNKLTSFDIKEKAEVNYRKKGSRFQFWLPLFLDFRDH